MGERFGLLADQPLSIIFRDLMKKVSFIRLAQLRYHSFLLMQ